MAIRLILATGCWPQSDRNKRNAYIDHRHPCTPKQIFVAIMPSRGLSAGESSSSAAPPGTGATLDISVEVFGGPADEGAKARANF